MSALRTVRLGVVVVLATSMVAAGAAVAAAAERAPTPNIPVDVAALFAGPAVRQVQADAQSAGDAASPQAPDLSGTVTSGPIHQVFSFSDAFVSGTATDVPVQPTDEWQAALVRDGVALGTLRVWKPNGASAEVAGYTGDASLGKALLFDSGIVLVEDDTIGAHYTFDGSILTPLVSSALPELDGPVGIAEAQKVISARHGAIGAEGPVGGRGMGSVSADPGVRFGWIIGGALLLLTCLVGISSVGRSRRRARS